MIFKKIRWRNLLGYGNYFTEFNLTQDNLTIIIGENGSGKSTLLDSLCFVLFGSAFRNINKPMLVNTITNKELEVEVEFSVGKAQYLVRRGIKPAIFDIATAVGDNWVTLDQNAKKDQQQVLEEIIGCNKKTFCQIVVIGADYVPFLSLTPADRRKVVENILDLEVVAKMNVLLKKEATDLIEKIKDFEVKRDILQAQRKAYMDALNNSEIQRDKRVSEYQEQITRIRGEIRELPYPDLMDQKSEETLTRVVAEKNHKMSLLQDKMRDLKHDISDLEQLKTFFTSHATCPTCMQMITPDFVRLKIMDYDIAIKKCQEEIGLLEDDHDEIKTLISSATFDLNSNKAKKRIRDDSDFKVAQYENQIMIWSKKIVKEQETTSDLKEDVLEDLDNQLVVHQEWAKELYNEKAVMSTVGKLLKDDGIKAQIINVYMEFINQNINRFLVELDLFVALTLDSEFNEVIKSRYRDDFKYNSFSEGQKMRIDLAILLAWRELAQKRNSITTNLLIFDEVFSGSLDGAGVADLMQILRKRRNENIYLITHAESMKNTCEKFIEIAMENGYSRVVVQ